MPTSKQPITTVLLADAHPLLRRGLRVLLESEAGITVVGEAGDGEEAIAQAGALSPDVVVMDVTLPKLNGIDATLRILAKAPETRIIALSLHSEQCLAAPLLRAGVRACIPKEVVLEQLLGTIHSVMRGESPPNAAQLTPEGTDGFDSGERGEQTLALQSGMLAEPLLRTKLHRPATPPELVPRKRVLDRLDAGRVRPLVLVSAPAGYGKSATISNWLESRDDWPCGWFSLDPDDSDLRRFLSYFVAAVQSALPHACEPTQGLLGAARLPSLATLTASLSNDLDSIDRPFILVLDDYHLIDARSPVNELLQQLLAHPPIPLHLIIVSRRDPPLQLLTLRAQGQMTEVRMRDLRFDPGESRALLENQLGFTIGDAALANLQQEIEGWVVGLRLVSLTLSRLENRDEFLSNLHGGIQQTQDYLIQEVISQQSPRTQDRLVRSAILDRFCEPLVQAVCTAGTGVRPDYIKVAIEVAIDVALDVAETDAAGETARDGFIESALAGNLFVIHLDSGNEWFRYHHQFQQLLRHELNRRMAPDAIAKLHSRASEWFESQGLIEEAIQHSLKAGDVVNAAEIIERHKHMELDQDRWHMVERWMAMLPAAVIQQRPRLLLAQLWGLYNNYRMLEIPPLVERVQTLLIDESIDESSLGEINFYQGFMLMLFQGDPEAAVLQFKQARERLSRSSTLWIVSELEILDAISHQMAGSGAMALRSIASRSQAMGLRTGLLQSRLAGAQVFVELLSGHLISTVPAARRFASVCKDSGLTNTEGSGHYLRANAQLQSWQLDQALQGFQHSAARRDTQHQKLAIDTQVGLVLTYQALRRSPQAVEAMSQLMQFALESGEPEHIGVAQSCQARLSLLQGDTRPAIEWAHSFDPQLHAPGMLMWLEVPVLTHLRIMIVTGSRENLGQAGELLAVLRPSTEALHNRYQTIELLVLQSMVLERLESVDQALDILCQAITLAEPDGWVYPFVELGRPMAELLERLIVQTGNSDYLRHVLGQFPSPEQPAAGTAAGKPRSIPSATADSEFELLESLTRREVDVLELLAQRLQTKEIAARLFVSPETVKSHLKNLYQKLGVGNRREAAIKAAAMVSRQADSSGIHTPQDAG